MVLASPEAMYGAYESEVWMFEDHSCTSVGYVMLCHSCSYILVSTLMQIALNA